MLWSEVDKLHYVFWGVPAGVVNIGSTFSPVDYAVGHGKGRMEASGVDPTDDSA